MGMGASALKVKKESFKDCFMLTSTELGSGAFSTVRLAIDLKTSAKRAVKIVEKKKLQADDYQALLMEIEILKALNHEHIIRLYQTYEEPKQFLLVTEIVLGGELFDRIVNKSHYSEKEARELIKIMLTTLAYIHESGIVHRDLKPENLLLCSEDNDSDIKFADFGFAKHIKDLKEKEIACGTPGYAAPEVLRLDPYGAEVDVWSMGVICYVLLSGHPPFYDEDQKTLFEKIKEGRYYFHDDYWGHVSPAAVDLIKHMLVVNQKQRWTAKQLLEHDWLKMDDEILQAKDLSSSQTALKKFNAQRRLRAAAHAVILANRMKTLSNKKQVKPEKGGNKYAAAKSKRGLSLIDMAIVEQSEMVVLETESSSRSVASFLKDKDGGTSKEVSTLTLATVDDSDILKGASTNGSRKYST